MAPAACRSRTRPSSDQQRASAIQRGNAIARYGRLARAGDSALHVIGIADLEWCRREGLGPVEHTRRLHVLLEVCLVRLHRSPTLDHHEPVWIIVALMDVEAFKSLHGGGKLPTLLQER